MLFELGNNTVSLLDVEVSAVFSPFYVDRIHVKLVLLIPRFRVGSFCAFLDLLELLLFLLLMLRVVLDLLF